MATIKSKKDAQEALDKAQSELLNGIKQLKAAVNTYNIQAEFKGGLPLGLLENIFYRQEEVDRLLSQQGGDRNYVQGFVNKNDVTVDHNLGKYPSVTVVDSGKTEIIVQVEYVTLNRLRVYWNGSPISGQIFVN